MGRWVQDVESCKELKFFFRLRAGNSDLNVDRLRYRGIARQNRLCTLCELKSVEDAEHFLKHCPAYSNLRTGKEDWDIEQFLGNGENIREAIVFARKCLKRRAELLKENSKGG
jgi:hypothetical protein